MEEFAKESMGERIKSLRSERGDTRNEFARQILTGREEPVDSRQFFCDMEKLSPHTQVKMKQLMEIAYELAKEEK